MLAVAAAVFTAQVQAVLAGLAAAVMVGKMLRLELLELLTQAVEVAAAVASVQAMALAGLVLSFCPFSRQITQELQRDRPQSPLLVPTPLSSSRHQGVTQREPFC